MCRAPTTADDRGHAHRPGPVLGLAHYFTLLGAPFRRTAGRSGGLVTIRPDYDANRPVYTGCETRGRGPAPRTARPRCGCTPRRDATPPLVKDIGLRPDGSRLDDRRQRHRRAGLHRPAVRGRRPPGRLDGDLVPRPEGVVPEPRRRPTAVQRAGRWSSTPEGRADGGPGVRPRLPGGGGLPGGRAGAGGLAAAVQAARPGSGTWPGLRTPGEYYYADHLRPGRAPGGARPGAVLPDPVRPPGGVRAGATDVAGDAARERTGDVAGMRGPGAGDRPRAGVVRCPAASALLEHLRGQRLEQRVQVVGDGPVPGWRW